MDFTTFYKRRKLRQKPNILTVDQSLELAKLAGIKSVKNVADQGLIPTNLFRLRKRKLEAIYSYLFDHQLIHDKEPVMESLQTHQLAEYLLNTIYPGYPASKAKNLAYTDYRECREKEIGQICPLAYDYVPTTEIYERLDEMYRADVNWQEDINSRCAVEISVPTLKKSLERIRIGYNDKPRDGIEYHLCFWNSTRTLIKPQCKSLRLNSQEIWTDKKEKVVAEGFMHINITEELKASLARPSRRNPRHSASTALHSLSVNNGSTATKANCKTAEQQAKGGTERVVKLEVELNDNEEYNISHISIFAVTKKTTHQLICELYLQATTECIWRSIRKSSFPLDTQQIVIHLLRQYHQAETPEDKLKNAEAIFMTCQSNTMLASSTGMTSSEEEYEDDALDETVSLIDSVSKNRIQHPLKSLHCRHRTCFDASSFFQQHADIKLWHCPICLVHIKSFEELRVDYAMKEALNQYPDQDKLFVYGDALISESELIGEASRLMMNQQESLIIEIEDGDEEEAASVNRKQTLGGKRSVNNSTENHNAKRYRTLTHVM